VFRRRRGERADEPLPARDAGDPSAGEDSAGEDGLAGARDPAASSFARVGAGGEASGRRGPWDVADSYPERERIDLGSLRIPAASGLDVQVNFTGEQALAVMVVRGQSVLQMQAFAAPKRAGLWDDVRREVIEELRAAGGQGEEAAGPFGLEVRARVPAETAPRGGGPHGSGRSQPARFLGADGPRWFLRGVISGPAAASREQAKPLEDVFGDTVVVRGEHPVPPRDLLELRLPADAQQALDEQMGRAADSGEQLNPFARGPEITETR
jgi:Protein of unknown function (DUF3710)